MLSRLLTKQGPSASNTLSKMVLPVLGFLAAMNAAILITSICAVALTGNGPRSINFERVWIGASIRGALIAVWCLFPLFGSAFAVLGLVRHKTMNAMRLALSAAVGFCLYVPAFAIWGQCAYYGIHRVCMVPPRPHYLWTRDPAKIRWVMPWLALAAAIIYLAIMVISITVLVCQRKAAKAAAEQEPIYVKSVVVEEFGKSSADYSEVRSSTVGSETLPSRPRSSLPSGGRLPSYHSYGGDSLLSVDEKDEKRAEAYI